MDPFRYLPKVIYPLQKTTESQLLQLCQELWSWPSCENCHNTGNCETNNCPWKRSTQLMRFFKYYKDLCASYHSDSATDKKAALQSHDNLFGAIRKLKSDPHISRAELKHRLFGNRPDEQQASVLDQDRAINLALKVIFMVNCGAQSPELDILEQGAYHVRWKDDISFKQYVTDIFPTTDYPIINDDNEGPLLDLKTALTAIKLTKHAGLKFQPTDDLRRHLRLDRKNGIVEIFHHTAFLKEYLRLTIGKSHNRPSADYLELGMLPRQLALECLDSLQKVIFPATCHKSLNLLISLTTNSSFDPNCLEFNSIEIRTPDERNISYRYFGTRLIELYSELENPTPRGRLEKWLQRRSGARYAMLATVIGVAIAVLLGMASLAVGVYQAWIAYQQWQHPLGSEKC
ncbi:MAG: hypothetical protein M1834_006751 [Cirrosporium novae-zelandiae]|nr:MAG: hypothetical protein M1834_006751 [Cirrosporium novae-zelandiae]